MSNLLTGTLQDYNLKGILRSEGMYAAFNKAKKKKKDKKKMKGKGKGTVAKVIIEVDVKVE
jgi:hypothetical protein